MIELERLASQDAEAIERLARRYYPEEFAMDTEEVARNLDSADEDGCNFCVGAFTPSDGLVGYLLAWVDESMVEGRSEQVVLVDDLVLVPSARRQLFPMIETMIDWMGESHAGWPIEAAVRADQRDTFATHPDLFARLGYRLVGEHSYRDEELDEELVWIRFEALPEGDAEGEFAGDSEADAEFDSEDGAGSEFDSEDDADAEFDSDEDEDE